MFRILICQGDILKQLVALPSVVILTNAALVQEALDPGLGLPDQKQSCNAAIMESKWMGEIKGGADLRQRVKTTWLATAEKSLATNKSTFAMLPMSDLLNPEGLVASLRARGYQVDQPD